MKRFLLSIVLLCSVACCFSQTVISGCVKFAHDKTPVDMANVIIEVPGSKKVIAYGVTDANGNFSVSFSTDKPEVTITVAGFNVERTSRTVPAGTQHLELLVNYKELYLKGTTVRANPIQEHKDTITYYVSAFADSIDHSIGDVLKKMPGISVDKAGGIIYQGRKIDQFYIEGLDLMGSRYGTATNNVRAKDVATVEIYENHQPIKVLKSLFGDKKGNGRVAINLKLRQKSKGVFISMYQLGTGCGPWMWDASMVGMYFSDNYQMLGTVKSNNSGTDIVSELTEQYEGTETLRPYIGVYSPATPNVGLERYMDNTTYAVSINNLFKLSKDKQFSVNGIYYYDKQFFADSSRTDYFMPSGEPLRIAEVTALKSKLHNADLRMKYTGNGEKTYIEETLSIEAAWNQDKGEVLTEENLYGQKFSAAPAFCLDNKLSFQPKVGKTLLNIDSKICVRSLPTSLSVMPDFLSSMSGYGTNGGSASLQTMSNRSFYTDESCGIFIEIAQHLFMDLNAHISADIQNMRSSLLSESLTIPADDSLRNDLGYAILNTGGHLGLNYSYKSLKTFLGINLDYSVLKAHDRIRNNRSDSSKPLLHPQLFMELQLLRGLKVNLISDYSQSFGPITDHYSGYIMTDYRHLCSRRGGISTNKMLNNEINFKYSNVLSALFANLSGRYSLLKSDLITGTTFVGSRSIVESYGIDNVSSGYSVKGSISKFFSSMSSTLELSAGVKQDWMDILRQGEVMNFEIIQNDIGFKSITNWSSWLKMKYDIKFSHIKSQCTGIDISDNGIDAIHQKLSFDCTMLNKIIANVSGEHYFNSSIVSGSRHIPFMDASLTYKTRNVEYVIEGRNLLDMRVYSNRTTSEAFVFEYNYLLRQRSLMFRIKINLN